MAAAPVGAAVFVFITGLPGHFLKFSFAIPILYPPII